MGIHGACGWADGTLGFEETQELQEGVWERVPKREKSFDSTHPVKRPLHITLSSPGIKPASRVKSKY
jgi:hypothetical protein